MLESELRNKHINWVTNAKIVKVEDGKMQVIEHDSNGEVVREHELPFSYSMILPAFKGVDAVAAVGEDLVNPRGFVKVDEYQRNPKWNNIYSAGVCVAIPPIETTPVPTGALFSEEQSESSASIRARVVESTQDRGWVQPTGITDNSGRSSLA